MKDRRRKDYWLTLFCGYEESDSGEEYHGYALRPDRQDLDGRIKAELAASLGLSPDDDAFTCGCFYWRVPEETVAEIQRDAQPASS